MNDAADAAPVSLEDDLDKIAWTEEMSVGSEMLDEHHRMLINCLNQLGELLENSAALDEINKVLATLEEFVLMHFSAEEQAMRAAGFPGWREHKEQHDAMYDAVYTLKSDVENKRDFDPVRLHRFLYEWLMQHIMGEDRKYMPFLKNPQKATAAVWHGSHGEV
jgi:hemerythrin